MNLKELLKQRVDDEDLLPELPQENKDKNTEIIKAYKEGYEQGKKDAIRHGRWINCGWSIKCSICDYDMPFAVRNYCPNCGAKMDLEGDIE